MSSTHARHRQQGISLTRRLPWAVGALVAVVASVAVTGSSSASFVSRTGSTSTVTAAADWTPPSVTVSTPSPTVKGMTTIAAPAQDDVTGIDRVTIQRAAAGSSTWTTVCTARTAPYACDWNTLPDADGSYDLRATAVDGAGNSATSTTFRATVANNLTVSLPRPGDFLRGTVSTTVGVSNQGGVKISSVRLEFAPTGSTSWATACSSSTAPYTCSVDTSAVPGGTYDLRAVAVAGTATFASPVVSRVVVDNIAPAVTMTDPGTPLKGTKTFAAGASDERSGIAKVVVQAGSGSTWTDLCTATSLPASCAADTNTLANGTYTFRAVATDKAGNTTTSSPTAGRVVQNTVSSVTLTAPRTQLRGTVTLDAQAKSTGTIASVKFQRSPAGAGTWTDICTDTTSPYSCSFATTGLPDGAYDLRAVVTDSAGVQTPSAVVTDRTIDNTRGKGVDIQTTNGGTNGKVDAGDTIVYTFSEQMDLSSIYAGWSGTATSGSVQFSNASWWGGDDVLDVSGPGNADLGTVALNEDFFLLATSARVTMSATTLTDGGARTVVTIRLDSSPYSAAGTAKAADMVWSPSSSILDLAGNPISTSTVTESGPTDVDF
ncbi:signal peptidase I [Aeromicrobium sp. S22]|uniref:Ig-like domain-containing protein n=1 Tax=Aeromicrobium sp. S22 TaxID=2662029 RepID=UPI00129E2A45|nr:Ig-like domain-containing protein [Aeromicrobium sp. S22]MRK02736.1 signal peptidase I [Aeromicrobium sp. S22]